MGIYDRDYIREDRPQPAAGRGRPSFGIAALGAWSVTTWLIIICCAVFFIDSMMPARFWQPVLVELRLTEDAPDKWTFLKHPDVDTGPPRRGWFQFSRTAVDPDTLEPVGRGTFHNMPPLQRWLYFSTEKGFLQVQFWRLIGFQFLHADLPHLIFNMIGLFFFGPLVENYLGRKRFLAFYLLSGICGALMYVLLNLGGIFTSLFVADARIPLLLFHDPRVPLVGASAGVFGVLMAGAYLAPRAIVLLFFFIPMELKFLAYMLVALAAGAVIFGGANAGGEAGHLGGAIAGFYFIRHPHHLHGFFDIIGYADPTSHHYRKSRGPRGPTVHTRRSPRETAELDRILIKIKEEGMDSLTARERRILQEESRRG